MANRITKPEKSPKTKSPSFAVPQDNTKAELVAENKRLRKDLKALTKERDSLLGCAYAWARQELTLEETEKLIEDFKDGLPLKDFMHEIDQIGKDAQK